MALFVVGMNATSDNSKWLYETILWYLCQISRTLFVHTTTRKRLVIFTCRYFKKAENTYTTALDQSNCRNFSCRSIMGSNTANDVNT